MRQILEDKNGKNIAVLDLRGISDVADFLVLVSGTSPPHLKAMSAEVQRRLKPKGAGCFRHAGDPDCGWMVLDYVDVVAHIFLDHRRRYYAIEELWAEAPRLDRRTETSGGA